MSSAQLNILIVEDVQMYRSILLSNLSAHKCRIAKTLKEARQLYDERNPDIVFLDIELPDGRGLDFLAEITDKYTTSYVVMMTGSASAKDVSEAQANGAMGYILKPFNSNRIFDTIDHYMDYRDKLIELACDERETEIIKRYQDDKDKNLNT